jgi:MFS family permease
MFQVAYLLCAPFVGQNLQKVGRKNMILIGYTLCIMATVGFGLAANVPYDTKENPNTANS